MKRFLNCPICGKEMRSSDIQQFLLKGSLEFDSGESDCVPCRLFTDFDEKDKIIRIEFQGREWENEEFKRVLKIMSFK